MRMRSPGRNELSTTEGSVSVHRSCSRNYGRDTDLNEFKSSREEDEQARKIEKKKNLHLRSSRASSYEPAGFSYANIVPVAIGYKQQDEL